MAVDYNDKRLTQVENDKKVALSESEKLYAGMINNSDQYYQQQIDAAKDYEETQKKNQQAQTDFAIEKIEQQKGQAKKDYIKEQSAAWVDYQKQVDPYGVQAEQVAAMGMQNTGYAESLKVSMYNTYQNRIMVARESYNLAVLNYDNAIKDAQLQNNSILADIAYKALQQQLELSLAGFQYKNNLLLEQANKKLEIDQMYHSRYQDVLDQINTENQLAEQQRQFNENMAFQKEKEKQDNAIAQAQLALQREQFDWQKSQATQKSDNQVKKDDTKPKSKTDDKKVEKYNQKIGKVVAANSQAAANIKTYSEACKFLEAYGAGDYNLMTQSEWQRRKSSYNRTGVGGVAVSGNKTYYDYLQTSIKYALS